jgi:hypothetical protein
VRHGCAAPPPSGTEQSLAADRRPTLGAIRSLRRGRRPLKLCVRRTLWSDRPSCGIAIATNTRSLRSIMASRKATPVQWKNIEWLIRGEGDITLGRVGSIRCAATAADGHNALAMLVRRPGESLEAFLTRLDEAIRKAVEEDVYTDEING